MTILGIVMFREEEPMELLTVAGLAHKVKLGPCRILGKTRRGQIPRIKAPVRFDLEAILRALQGNDVLVISE
jgi:hypothetical protein